MELKNLFWLLNGNSTSLFLRRNMPHKVNYGFDDDNDYDYYGEDDDYYLEDEDGYGPYLILCVHLFISFTFIFEVDAAFLAICICYGLLFF